MLNRLYLLILLMCGLNLHAQDMSSVKISLLTCGSGDELYSTFGHSAVRVNNTLTNQDIVYNYGTFNFDEPNFYLKFLRGKLNYKLAVNSFQGFMREYKYFKRSVHEQELNLNSEEKIKLVQFLNHNALPENRDYKYDFFFDNCSTRIRDLFENELGLKFDTSPSDKTYRDLLDEDLHGMPWSDFGIDIVIGSIADRNASQYGQMFIPDYLMDNIENVQLASRSFVSNTSTLLDHSAKALERSKRPWFNPLLVFGIFLIIELIFAFLYFKKKRSAPVLYDKLWYLLVGIIGLVIFFLWFFTDHMATKSNFNLLWISPVYLLFLFKKVSHKLKIKLHVFLASISLIFLAFFPWIPQNLHLAFVPILMILTSIHLRNIFIKQHNSGFEGII